MDQLTDFLLINPARHVFYKVVNTVLEVYQDILSNLVDAAIHRATP